MHRFIFKFSTIVSIIALVTAVMSGVSFMTSVIRAGFIFMATALLFVVLLHFLRWAIISTTIIEHHDHKEHHNHKPGEEHQKQNTKLGKTAIHEKLIGD